MLKQQSYTSTKPAISSTLANTPYAKFGVGGILEMFDAALSASYNINSVYEHHVNSFQVSEEFKSRLSSRLPHLILEPYIERNDDFGTAYAHLCHCYWYPVTGFNKYLHRQEKGDQHNQHRRQISFTTMARAVVTIYSFFLSKRLLSYLIFSTYSYLIFRSTTPRSLHIVTRSYSTDVSITQSPCTLFVTF